MKILIFGPRGSGKTALAEPLVEKLNAVYIGPKDTDVRYNAYSTNKTAERLRFLALGVEKAGKIAIIDWEAPTSNARALVSADFVVWMDTVGEVDGFTQPCGRLGFNYHVSEWFNDTDKQLAEVVVVWLQTHKQ